MVGVLSRLDMVNGFEPFGVAGLCAEFSSEAWKEVREGSGE